MGKKRRAESREGMIHMSVAFTSEMHRRLAIAALEDRAAIVELSKRFANIRSVPARTKLLENKT